MSGNHDLFVNDGIFDSRMLADGHVFHENGVADKCMVLYPHIGGKDGTPDLRALNNTSASHKRVNNGSRLRLILRSSVHDFDRRKQRRRGAYRPRPVKKVKFGIRSDQIHVRLIIGIARTWIWSDR